MRCKTCHYSLKYLTEHRCPECGDAFDPADPSTFLDSTMLKRRFWLPIAICAGVVYFILVTLNVLDEYGILDSEPAFTNPGSVDSFPTILLGSTGLALILFPFALPIGLLLFFAIQYLIVRTVRCLRLSRSK